METNILITDKSHNQIYQTYAELKKKLPPTFFKMKVFSTPKYNFDKKPILKKIENDKTEKINPKTPKYNILQSLNKNIYILSNKTINLKKQKNLKPIFHEYDEIIKKNLLLDKEDNSTRNTNDVYQSFLAGLEEPAEEMEAQHYYFHSSSIKDAQMKNNIYLPKIMDRMKYSVPRFNRDKNGFLVEGKAVVSNRLNHDEHKNNLKENYYKKIK